MLCKSYPGFWHVVTYCAYIMCVNYSTTHVSQLSIAQSNNWIHEVSKVNWSRSMCLHAKRCGKKLIIKCRNQDKLDKNGTVIMSAFIIGFQESSSWYYVTATNTISRTYRTLKLQWAYLHPSILSSLLLLCPTSPQRLLEFCSALQMCHNVNRELWGDKF